MAESLFKPNVYWLQSFLKFPSIFYQKPYEFVSHLISLPLCMCLYVWLHRSTVLRRAWHHDHQIRGRVSVFNGGFWLPCGLPLLLDHCHGAEALLLRHHHTELCRICLHSFLPRLFSSSSGYQVSVSSSHM